MDLSSGLRSAIVLSPRPSLWSTHGEVGVKFYLGQLYLDQFFLDPCCPKCFRCPVCHRPLHWSLPRLRPCLLCCVNGLRCGLLLSPFRQFGIRRHSLAKGLTKGHTAHYKRSQGCKLLIYTLLMLMTTGSARRLNTDGRNSITVGCTW